jgi:transcriptional antiterminator
MTDLSNNISALRDEGMTYKQIQEKLGCSKATISYHIGAGQAQKTRNRTRDRRNKIVKFIQEYKQNNPCTDCGENYPYWIMEFDHLDDKLFNVSSFRQKTESLEEVKKEIAKCELVCSNCHKNRTHFRLVSSNSSTMDISKHYEQ